VAHGLLTSFDAVSTTTNLDVCLGNKSSGGAPRAGREIFLAIAGITATLLGSFFAVGTAAATLSARLASARYLETLEPFAFMLMISMLVYGSLVYQFARIGYFRRVQTHVPASEAELDTLRSRFRPPSLTVLVPSYKEQRGVVLKTLLSAALLDYPHRHVVLLIDDSPTPATEEDTQTLVAARALERDVQALLEVPRRAVLDALHRFERRCRHGSFNAGLEAIQLCDTYTEAAGWLDKQAAQYPIIDHTDQFFVDITFSEPAARFIARGKRLPADATSLSPEAVREEYRHLLNRFTATISTFERKQYVGLSHDPNKAMNLNSYLGVMGHTFRDEAVPSGRRLVPAAGDGADIRHFPDSDYVMVLDADSVVHPAYATRLIHFLEQPAHQRVAVVQTPYSAFPKAAEPLERVAGATTDVQHVVHQGFTFYGATFWVGANAIVRKRALDTIKQWRIERGNQIPIFIQDRTVIEDTESSLDLSVAGWRLHNYPERLAYSATPADFGALVIQRRRWANGGLIIVPKLVRHVAYGWRRGSVLVEAFFRFHYLTSLAIASIGVLAVLTFSFDRQLMSVWIPIAAVPYYVMYARDLIQSGYSLGDLPRVYALNLLLLPIHFSGVLQSMQQLCSGRKSPFGRTPKVEGRTATAPAYIVFQYGLLVAWLLGATREYLDGRTLNAVLASINALFLYYALHTFVKHRNAGEDVLGWLRDVCTRALRRPASHGSQPDCA
jgi:cellulose synthase/poly-beta-1,6-N-acetylglucosamine synthase-like glycosyltransferase